MRIFLADLGHNRFTIMQAPFRDGLSAAHSWVSVFDMEAWRADGYRRELWHCRFQEPMRLEARVTPERKALIETRIATFGEHPAGLGKFTRSMFAHDLRRKVEAMGAAA